MYIDPDYNLQVFGYFKFIDSIFNNNKATTDTNSLGNSGAVFIEGANLVDFKNCNISNN